MPKDKRKKQQMFKILYSSAIRSLMYIMICRGPDVAYIIALVRKFHSNLHMTHWRDIKRILRHLKGNVNFLFFLKERTYNLLDLLMPIGLVTLKEKNQHWNMHSLKMEELFHRQARNKHASHYPLWKWNLSLMWVQFKRLFSYINSSNIWELS